MEKVKKGEQHVALALKRDDGHRRREDARGIAWFSIAFIKRCVFLEIWRKVEKVKEGEKGESGER